MKLVDFFCCGVYHGYSTRSSGEYRVVALDKIIEKILPFFHQYPLQGSKKFIKVKFCDCAYLMNDKAHLTCLGLEKIKSIKADMNKR